MPKFDFKMKKLMLFTTIYNATLTNIMIKMKEVNDKIKELDKMMLKNKSQQTQITELKAEIIKLKEAQTDHDDNDKTEI